MALGTMALALAGCLAAANAPASAEVKTSSVVRYYDVPGSSLAEFARFVARNPLSHRDTGALGRTEASFDLELMAALEGKTCRATDAMISAKFVITLPKASEARLGKADRARWREFTGFVRRHEEMHRTIYTQCMNSFDRTARRLSSSRGCAALTADAQKRFESALRACEQRHDSLDARDRRTLERLPLFRTLQ
jgi:predicted secreted Zn-dependent protease